MPLSPANRRRLSDRLNHYKNDLRAFARDCLQIRLRDPETDNWCVKPFDLLTPEQEAVLCYVEDCIRDGKPIRVIIDKCRKLGMSTLIEAIGYWLCVFHPHFQALVVAQQKDSTRKIAQIARRYDLHLPKPLVPYLAAEERTQQGLYWSEKHGSMFEVLTQRSEEAARGSDPSFIHISELGSWHKRRASISEAEVLTALEGGMGLDPGTYMLVESTAGGAAGEFYSRYVRAVERFESAGLDDKLKVWRPFFFSWQGVPKYTSDVSTERSERHAEMVLLREGGDTKKSIEVARELGYVDDHYGLQWFERIFEFGITAGEMAFALAKLEGFRGDLRAFDQEYPLSWQMSFLTSGRPVFPSKVVESWRRGVHGKNARGEDVRKPTPILGYEIYNLDGEYGCGGFGNNWEIYREPVPGHEYVIGVDTATGDPEGDFSTIAVFDRHTREFVAHHYARRPPDVIGHQAVMAARWYNSALINPEENGDGGTTIRRMLDMGYPYIQLRHPGRGIPENANWRSVYGTNVSSKNRNDLVNYLREAVRDETIFMYHRQTIDEMTTFLYDNRNRPDHLPNKHSDGIFACIHALYADAVLSEARTLGPPPEPDADWSVTRRREIRKQAVKRAQGGSRRRMRRLR